MTIWISFIPAPEVRLQGATARSAVALAAATISGDKTKIVIEGSHEWALHVLPAAARANGAIFTEPDGTIILRSFEGDVSLMESQILHEFLAQCTAGSGAVVSDVAPDGMAFGSRLYECHGGGRFTTHDATVTVDPSGPVDAADVAASGNRERWADALRELWVTGGTQAALAIRAAHDQSAEYTRSQRTSRAEVHENPLATGLDYPHRV